MDIQKTIQQFKEEGFKVSYFETKEEAAASLEKEITGTTVGMGGSITIEQMGLYEKLEKNNKVYWHWRQPAQEAREQAVNAEVYISSANGISQTGEIINIDGSGNRVASLNYGHKKAIIIVGINKIEETFEKALWRARNIAAPLNAKRLNSNTPCAQGTEMKCYDCKSPERICRGFSIINRKMGGIEEVELVIINEELGY